MQVGVFDVVENAAIHRDPEPIIAVSGVSKTFGTVHAVDTIDLKIFRGETVALLGPNGAGKTTTINMLLGLLTPTTGSIHIFRMSPTKAIQQSLVGAMIQEGKMIPGVTISEFIDFVRSLHPHPLPKDQLIEIAGLQGLLGRRLDRLSGGQTQRVRFSMAIAGNPELLLLDEPTAAMDVETRREFWSSMQAYASLGHTILFATHYLEEAEAFASRLVIIARGKIVIDGTIEFIQQQYGEKRVTCNVPADAISAASQLAGVQRYETHNHYITLFTGDVDATVRALAASTIPWQNISISGIALEDIFLSLVRKGESK